MRRPLLFFAATGVVLAVVEVLLLIFVGRHIGVLWTVVLILATSLLGATLLRREGPRSWRAFRADLQEGRPPGQSAAEGLSVLVGGVLMVLPGFLTDAIGILLVLPATRRVSGRLAQSALTRRLSPSAATSLFGPRTVRVRTGAPQAPPGPPASPPPAGAPPVGGAGPEAGEVVEGEIIDPGR